MTEIILLRCRILSALRLHGRLWLFAPTPRGYRACRGCGRIVASNTFHQTGGDE